MTHSADILGDLQARKLLVQSTGTEALAAHLGSGMCSLYCGFDPTADSLHIGNLLPLLVLRRFQQAGHRPILLVGGATGLIGDPSGKAEERQLQSAQLVAERAEAIRTQAQRFLDFDGTNGAVLVNNIDWIAPVGVIEFLRDVGKHFSVNMMMRRDSVRLRLEREQQGLSYTEFSYMLLQSMDFLQLARSHDCSLQIGGSDQWGNMISGVDLIRRVLHREAHVLTLPLVTRADGTKFGKTADGAVWLDEARTSPYRFHQFWLNVSDTDVLPFLRYFSFLALDELDALLMAQQQSPGQRVAQKALADSLTTLVHGTHALGGVKRIADALFSGSVGALTDADLRNLAHDGMDCTSLDAPLGLLDALTRSGLAASNGAARKLVQSGGVSINGKRIEDAEQQLSWDDALFGRYYLLRRGKKHWHLLQRTQ